MIFKHFLLFNSQCTLIYSYAGWLRQFGRSRLLSFLQYPVTRRHPLCSLWPTTSEPFSSLYFCKHSSANGVVVQSFVKIRRVSFRLVHRYNTAAPINGLPPCVKFPNFSSPPQPARVPHCQGKRVFPRMSFYLGWVPTQMATGAANLSGRISPFLADCHRRIGLYLQILTWQNILHAHLVAATVYVVALVAYRLYFSPIAAFPGPFLAKVTHWYEFYHNVLRTGMYYKEIRKMHDKYGAFFPPKKTGREKEREKMRAIFEIA